MTDEHEPNSIEVFPDNDNSFVKVRNLTKYFGDLLVLDNVVVRR